MIVSGSDDKCVKLWDRQSKQCIHTFFEHAGYVAACSLARSRRPRARRMAQGKCRVPVTVVRHLSVRRAVPAPGAAPYSPRVLAR